MADTTGVQVFVGPANQIELGTVTEGPTAVTLEKISDTKQRINFVISAPTAEVVTAANNSATAATNAATDAAASKTAAQTAQASAGTAAADANSAKTAAQTAAASVTDEALNAAVLRVITPGTLLIDSDGRPYFN